MDAVATGGPAGAERRTDSSAAKCTPALVCRTVCRTAPPGGGEGIVSGTKAAARTRMQATAGGTRSRWGRSADAGVNHSKAGAGRANHPGEVETSRGRPEVKLPRQRRGKTAKAPTALGRSKRPPKDRAQNGCHGGPGAAGCRFMSAGEIV